MRLIDVVNAADTISEKLNIPLSELVDIFAEVPTVDDPLPYYKECDNCKNADKYEPKKGKWNPIDVYTAQCSNCGKTHRTNGADLTRKAYVHKALYKFCPNCGARMEESDEIL